MYDYRCKVLRVIDGDTVEADIDLGFDCHYISSVRLQGINAPEITGANKQAGLDAKVALENFLAPGNVIIMTTLRKDKDKFGRVLGVFMVNGVNVNQQMIDGGHSVAYMT